HTPVGNILEADIFVDTVANSFQSGRILLCASAAAFLLRFATSTLMFMKATNSPSGGRVSGIEAVSTHEGLVLWTLEEISRVVSRSGSPAETLTNIVHLIRRRFQTDVCSVYLLESDRSTLVLAATIGLRPESVGRIRMRLNEGLAGLVAEQMRPQVVADATTHPRFKYFGEAGEDPYHSFLGVPVIDRGLLQGVLIVQTIEPRAFTQDDVRMLVMAGAQLAPIVSEARTLGQVVAPMHQRLWALAQNLWW